MKNLFLVFLLLLFFTSCQKYPKIQLLIKDYEQVVDGVKTDLEIKIISLEELDNYYGRDSLIAFMFSFLPTDNELAERKEILKNIVNGFNEAGISADDIKIRLKEMEGMGERESREKEFYDEIKEVEITAWNDTLIYEIKKEIEHDEETMIRYKHEYDSLIKFLINSDFGSFEEEMEKYRINPNPYDDAYDYDNIEQIMEDIDSYYKGVSIKNCISYAGSREETIKEEYHYYNKLVHYRGILDKPLAKRFKCTYQINNPLLYYARQEITKIYIIDLKDEAIIGTEVFNY